MNREHLQMMADHIRTVPQAMFDMDFYRLNSTGLPSPECKTVGCVIGHCTILDPSGFIGQKYDFDEWSEKYTGLEWKSTKWQWCFSPYWMRVDNTPEGPLCASNGCCNTDYQMTG